MEKKVLVETSARHVHVTREALDILFGEGYELTDKKELSQPGQFASNERVTVVGPKGELANVSILGPVRPATQVELALTDAHLQELQRWGVASASLNCVQAGCQPPSRADEAPTDQVGA